MWPMVAEMMFDRKLSVGPPFFNAAFTPFMVLLGLVLPVGAMLPWKRGKLGKTAWSLRYAFVLAVALGVLVWAMQTGRSALGPVGLFLGAWITFGAVLDLWSRTGRNGSLKRLFRLPGADWGKAVAHTGLGVTIFAIAGLTAWEVEDIRVAQPGQPFEVGQFTLTLEDVNRVQGPNYFSTMADVKVEASGRMIGTLHPEKRDYPVARMPTTEAAIDYRVMRDLYVVIGDQQADGGWVLRTYIKPFANWIWAGCLMMALGGVLSLCDRRFRVAAGARKAPSAGVPAE
jgi:cytochrome c-type biogenesis protein CcmF